jgi:hypothetical protein
MNSYLAEAKFMRAFTYFQLVRAWGGVPIYTEQNMHETTGVPKSKKDQVYELIMNDLEFAEIHLPDNPPVLGKPSKWSAKSLLADVYFFQGLNSQASGKANEVIQSNKYSLQELSIPDDFNNVFGLNASSAEEIFYLKYNLNSRSQLVQFSTQIKTPYFGTGGAGWFVWHTDSEFYKNWNDNDFRKQFNWYVETGRRNPFISGDPWFPSQGVTLLSPKKYNDPSGNATISTHDFTVYRYSDVLLIYAEATAHMSGLTEDAMEKLNMVHRRAYGYNPLQPSPVDFILSDYDKESFIDLVIQERGYEFQFEGKRWFDLVRSGKVKDIIRNNIGREIADKHLLWPIPPIEFDLNEAMTTSDQNPGY